MKKLNRPKRVLHILSGFGMGGAETWMLEIVKYIHKHPELSYPQMEFLCTSGKKAVLDDEIVKYGGVIHYITLNKSTIISFIREYRKLLIKRTYIAIHDHQDLLSGWHFLMGIGVNPKTKIAHVHNAGIQILNNYGKLLRHRIIQFFAKYLIKFFASHITGTSIKVLREYNYNTEKKNILPLHCGFDINKYNRRKDNKKDFLYNEFGISKASQVILNVGRLDKHFYENHPRNNKNTHRSIKMFQAIKNKNVIMIFVGDNSNVKEKYLKYIKQLNLSNRIIFLGIRNDVPLLMQAADVLLFPSRAEGLGMVAVEAQACSLPVVASTAVPKECVVIEELIDFLDLEKSNEEWAEFIDNKLNEAKIDVPLIDSRWQTSPFNIKNSTKHLVRLYTSNEKD